MKQPNKTIRILEMTVLSFILAAVLVLCANQVAGSKEQEFPARAIGIICPFAPGGSTEIELRNLSPYLKKYLGQPVIIRLLPGAGTTIGGAAAARAKPDGYTLICNPVPTTILGQELHDSDAHLENFHYIYGWSEAPSDVATRTDSPYKTFSDLVEAGRSKPLKVSVAGIGTNSHLQVLLIEKYTGLRAVVIPYGGGAVATAAVIRGDVDFYVSLATTTVRFVRAGQIRQLAILGSERFEALPDTPTIYELGYKEYPNIPFVRGVSAPPGTPEDRIKILEAGFKKAVDDPGFRGTMKKQGRPVKTFSGETLKKLAEDSLGLARQYMPIMKKGTEKK